MGRACNEKGGDKRACKRECRDTIMSKRKGRKKELKQCKRACNEKGGDKRACKRECRDTIMSKTKGRKKELKQCKRVCNEKGGDKRSCKRECRNTIVSKTKGRNPLVKWALNGIAKFASGAYSKYLGKLSEHTGKGAATQMTNADTLKLQGTSPSPLPVKESIKND